MRSALRCDALYPSKRLELVYGVNLVLPLSEKGSIADGITQLAAAWAKVRKRAWSTGTGQRKEAWICDYKDTTGKRHIETFRRKRDGGHLEGDAELGL